MGEYKLLKFLDKFKGLYTRVGVDYEKMRIILKIKLTLDRRRTSTIMGSSNKKDEESENSFVYALIMYGIIGAFIGIIILSSSNAMFSFSIAFGMFMFFVLTSFISDFSNVLLDVRDKNVIGTKGVNNKTIAAAKVTHICYYIFLISLALSWLSIIGMFRFGILTGILFLGELIVADILMIVITALIYLFILRFFNGEKVKDIINFVQIALTIVMTIGYQFLGRMFNVFDLNIVYKSRIWNLLLPPMWFAAPLYAVNGGEINKIIIMLITLAFIVPIIAIILYLKNISKFEDSLSKLNSVRNNEKEKSKGVFYRFGRWTCRNNEEKATYNLSVSVMKREREFKLKAYPNLGFIIIFPILFIFIFTNNYEGIESIPLSMSLNIYWFILMIPSILMTLQYSNDYKAAWIYESVFIKDTANIYRGAYKALIVNLLLPLYLVESVIFTVIFGIQVLGILIIVFIFLLIFIATEHIIGKLSLPFTTKAGVVNNGSNLLNILLGMILVGIAATINYFLLSNIIAMIVYGIALLIVALFMWRKCIKTYL
ncbi:MAG: ABC transporter, permease protein [Clostridium butyricum DORA_1]|nr:MAG: ABC transporter, permease protein [Clostridium butyricum DORA_1]MDU1509521.1 ABC transporter permease [Clostridium butyricum]MDU4802339.1 ABC transporter permease [Clostridium butyricum]